MPFLIYEHLLILPNCFCCFCRLCFVPVFLSPIFINNNEVRHRPRSCWLCCRICPICTGTGKYCFARTRYHQLLSMEYSPRFYSTNLFIMNRGWDIIYANHNLSFYVGLHRPLRRRQGTQSQIRRLHPHCRPSRSWLRHLGRGRRTCHLHRRRPQGSRVRPR